MLSLKRPFRAAALALTLGLAAGLTAAAPPSTAVADGNQPRERSKEAAPREFVALRDVAPTIRQEIRYTGVHNFLGDPVPGYHEPECLLTRDAATALRRAQRSVLALGYTLKVYDCYRPQRAVDRFVRWAEDLADERMKAEFYPRVEKDRLFADGYIAEQSGHSRGSTVDLTLVRLPALPTRPYQPGDPLLPCYAAQDERFRDNSIDMGTGFDCFDELSHTLSPKVSAEQRANRMLLKRALERVGFENLPEEWWHYTFQPEPFPDSYFDFPVARSSLTRF